MSAADNRQVLEDAKKFSAMFGGFIKAAEIIGTIGSLDQAVNEREQKLVAVNADIAQAESKREELLGDANKQAMAKIAEADKYSGEQRDAANDILRKAQAEATATVTTARSAADAITKSREQEISEHQRKINALLTEIDGLQSDREDAKAAADAQKKETADLAAEHDRVATAHNDFLASIGAKK